MRGLGKRLTLVCLVLMNAIFTFAYALDSHVYGPHQDYTNPILPRVGIAYRYRDPVFNRFDAADGIWRVSDALNTPRADGVRGNLTAITHEYSTTNPFSNDKNWLLLIHEAYFALYDGNGNFIRNLVPVCPLCAPRWSRTYASTFYFIRGNQMYLYDAKYNVYIKVGEPLNYDQVIAKGGDDICFDGDHLVGFGKRAGNSYLYVFSLATARVISELFIGGDAESSNIDYAEIAPNDIVLVSYRAHDRSAQGLPRAGIWAFDINLNPLRQVSSAGGHHDVGKDVDGSPILVMANSGLYNPLPNCRNGIEKISIDTPANRICLLGQLSWTISSHVSLPDQSGWAFIETEVPGDPLYGLLSRKEEISPQMNSTGIAGWKLDTSPVYSGLKAKWSDSSLSEMSFSFYGTTVHWISYVDAGSGIAQVRLDGEPASFVDLYSAGPVAQTTVYSRENLKLAFHRLTIAPTTTKNVLSSGNRVTIDAIEDDTSWTSYTNEILLVKLDGATVQRLAQHRSRAWNSYIYQPRVSASRDGGKIVWDSNYGLQSAAYTDYADVYMMEISPETLR